MKRDLDRYAALVRRHWLVVVAVCIIGLILMPFVAPSIPAYHAEADLLVVSDAAKDTTVSDPSLPVIITSNEVLSRVIARLHLDTDPLKLAKKIKTKLPAKSSVIQVTYKDANGERAAAVVNAVADEATTYYHEIATRGYVAVLDLLKKQRDQSRLEVAEADRKMHLLSAQNAVFTSDNALSDLTIQFDALRAARDQAAATLAADLAIAAGFGSQLTQISPIVRGEILSKDVTYQQVLSEYAKDRADVVSERSSFTDSFPGLSALEQRTTREGKALSSLAETATAEGAGLSPSYTATRLDLAKAQGIVGADRQRLATMDQQIADAQQHLRIGAGASASVGTLRAEHDAALQRYMQLTSRVSDAEGDAAQAASLGTLVVISRAVPGPSSLLLWLALMELVFVALALGIAYALDTISPRFWGEREIEAAYGRPIFGAVGRHA